jgi:hypothetical protein
MSFKSVLQSVEKGLGIAVKDVQVISPLVSELYPPAGAILSVSSALVMDAEKLFPDPTPGADKKQNVMSEISAALPLLQAGLSLSGVKLQITPEFTGVVSDVVDDVVKLLNDLSKLKAVIDGVPVVSQAA